MTRAEEARMQLEQHINRLKDAVDVGNKKGAHGVREII
jgi:LPS O-antigen subunit length determinant protein (WzzB/FepE family)